MKNLVLFLSFLVCNSLFAQEKIIVKYDVIPDYKTKENSAKIILKNTYYNLIIDQEESEFTKIDRIENQQEETISAPVLFIVQIGPSGTLYKNTKTNLLVEDRQFVDKNFLVKDALPKIDWKISKEEKEILGFICYKATSELEDGMKVMAWYAPKLPYKTGPDKFWGLPGLILEVQTEVNHGNDEIELGKYIATHIETTESKQKIKIPDTGKLINEKEYTKFTNDFYKKQMEMYSNGVDKD